MVVKFVGDVRLSLCTTLDQLIGDVFSAGYPACWNDLAGHQHRLDLLRFVGQIGHAIRS